MNAKRPSKKSRGGAIEDAALREQFVALAGQAFDFMLAFASRLTTATHVFASLSSSRIEHPLLVKEAARRLAISPRRPSAKNGEPVTSTRP